MRSLRVLPQAADRFPASLTGTSVRLFADDDWAKEQHDIEVIDDSGKVTFELLKFFSLGGWAQLHCGGPCQGA